MVKGNEKNSNTADREIVITRLLNAPRELVFKVWTQPDHVVQWWGPTGFTTTNKQMEVKPGGIWRFTMHGPDGVDYPNRVTFIEIAEPERLVYKHGWDLDDDPDEFDVTVTFEAEGNKTRLTMHSVFPTVALYKRLVRENGAIEGAVQHVTRLEEHLYLNRPTENPGEGVFVITRTFNAPRDIVFKAWTEEKQLAQWWGPKGFDIIVAGADIKPGGFFHYCMKSPTFEMWGKFYYREIAPPDYITFVNTFSDKDGNITIAPFFDGKWPLEIFNKVTFADEGDKTTITIVSGPIKASAEEMEMFNSQTPSMQQGYGGTFDKLDELLKK